VVNNDLDIAQLSLSILDINLRDARVTVREDVDAPFLSQEFANTSRQTYRKAQGISESEIKVMNSDQQQWHYRFGYECGIRLVDDKDLVSDLPTDVEERKISPLVEVVAHFEARYVSKEKLSDAAISAFAEHNVGFNVWPYWREIVQSMCSRIGVHPCFTIPLYRMPKRSPSQDVGEDSTLLSQKS
jgi:hypothetical protein